MKKNHVPKKSENPSTKKSNPTEIYEQLDLFEWAGINGESCVGFAVRNGL